MVKSEILNISTNWVEKSSIDVFIRFTNLLSILILVIVSFRLGFIPLWLTFFRTIRLYSFFLNNVLFSGLNARPISIFSYNSKNIRSLDLEFYDSRAVRLLAGC